ncbi:digestive organ expansion factor [Crassisporium funariophilum]|nr:digestive organ expansion factor [Crassisporium funariophilum]
MDDGNSVTTRLLTLLNVSATKIGKRKRAEVDFVPAEKLNRRQSLKSTESDTISEKESKPIAVEETMEPATDEVGETKDDGDDVEAEETAPSDSYEQHFGVNPAGLSESSRTSVESHSWKTSREKVGKYGTAIVSIPETSDTATSSCISTPSIIDNFKTPFTARQGKQAQNQVNLQNDLLSTLSTNKDLYVTYTALESRRCMREAMALHVLNHVTKKRRRVLKNNERLTRATKTNPDAPLPEDVQDQGFTRPSILILLPFRSSALDWFNAITSHTPPPAYQVENRSRFLSEYGLPAGAIDKLVTAEPGTYPPDHVETFKGNVDDNFRVGMKMTRKTVKMFADFYGCDIIIASPLGLRRSIEKEKNGDYLSSIEVLIVDQMDALTMQNWDHVKFVMSHLNKLPKESHDTDFSRIKPWYLDGHAAYLRQSILLSAYETPETRFLYNSSLKNVAGKIRIEKRWSPVAIPAGIDQNFIHFDCVNPVDEPEKRFHHFTTQLLPAVLKSAVQSTNTIIFVPSSFDFIRVHNYFRKSAGVPFAVLSEYSTNQDISRARQGFFKGQKSFLLISERFHFYKRYKIRGCRNIIFYGPPDHPQYFTEFLSHPFLDEGVEASDVTCRVLFSNYDRFKLERIAGTEAAIDLIKAS